MTEYQVLREYSAPPLGFMYPAARQAELAQTMQRGYVDIFNNPTMQVTEFDITERCLSLKWDPASETNGVGCLHPIVLRRWVNEYIMDYASKEVMWTKILDHMNRPPFGRGQYIATDVYAGQTGIRILATPTKPSQDFLITGLVPSVFGDEAGVAQFRFLSAQHLVSVSKHAA